MKVFRLLICASMVAALFSCNVEEPAELPSGDVTPGYVLVDLSAELEAVKSDISDGHTVWTAGDAIKIYWDGGSGTASLVSGAGTSSAVFRGEVPEGKAVKYAVYPADAESSLDGSTVSVKIPGEQDGSFKAGNIAVSDADGSGVLHFFNVNSFICVQLTGSDISKIEVESVDGSPLAGVQGVSFASGAAIGQASSTSSSVSMTAGAAGKYFISILPGVTHKSGLLLKYYKGGEVISYHLAKSVSTVRSHVLGFGEFEPDGNYYVTVAGAGNHSGVSWENAFSAAQMWEKLYLSGEESAEEKAAKIAAINGATFHLGAGTYDFGDNPNIKYEGDNTVVLHFKGGYPANGGSRNLSSYRADFTGADTHAALRVKGKVDVSFEGIGFVHGSVNEDEKGVIDLNGDPNEGWEITASMSYCYIGGNTNTSYADATHENHNQGAGLRLRWVSYFTADHVTFENNTSYAAAGAFVRNTQAEFTDCVFKNNTVYDKAGAVYVTGDSNDSSVTVFTSCTFDGNVTETYNGGAVLQNKGRGKYVNCTFKNNKAVNSARATEDGYGGAISLVGGTLEIKNCSFSGNVAYQGGCIAFSSSGSSTVEGTSFSGNGNKSLSGDGGALSVSKGDVTISNCSFTNNTAFNDTVDRTDGEGYGGAIDCYSEANLTVEDCTFSGNVAWRGGAMNLNSTGTMSLAGVTFTANGSDCTRAGGAVYGKRNWTVTDCTFISNTAKFGGALNHVQNDGNHGLVTLKGGAFQNNVATDCGGAICEESGMKIDLLDGVGTLFQDNKVTAETAVDCGGGALWAETYSTSSNKNVKVTGAIFKGNEAFSGGACLVYGGNSGLYLYDCTFGGENPGDANYARGGSGDGGGGTLYMDKKSYSTMRNCTITGDHAKRYGGSIYAHSNGGNFISEGCTFTGCYSSSGWGGAITSYKGKMSELTVKGSSFIGCHSNTGGAILCRLTEGKLAITDYNDVGCLFQGNYADHATSIYQGGAIQIEGAAKVSEGVSSLRVTIWKARFIGNYAGQGGAIYSKDTGKPDIYIDRCSFDGNYITKKWGPVLATDGLNRFQMNNCTIRNSYTTSTDPDNQTSLRPSWVAIDGLPADGLVTISNTTIIGDVQYSADGSSFTSLPSGNGLVAIWGSQPNYLINNIIVSNTSSVASVIGTGSEKVDLRYNQLGSVANIAQTDSGGNVTGLTASSIGGLNWTNNCWQWNGTIGGSAPAKTTATDVLDRLNAINKAYVDWIASPDDHFDYYGTNRGDGSWWPGAYQPK